MKTWKNYPITKNIDGSYTLTAVIKGQELPYNVCANDALSIISFTDVEKYYKTLEPDQQLIQTITIISEAEQFEALRNQTVSTLRKKLDNSDYYGMKFIDGAMAAEDYEPIKIKRASWRAAINAVQVASSIEDINIAMEGSAE